MNLARPFPAIALLLSLSLGLFALQFGGGRDRPQLSLESKAPSEFYFSRLHYNSGYTSGGSFRYRGFSGGWSQDYPGLTTIA